MISGVGVSLCVAHMPGQGSRRLGEGLSPPRVAKKMLPEPQVSVDGGGRRDERSSPPQPPSLSSSPAFLCPSPLSLPRPRHRPRPLSRSPSPSPSLSLSLSHRLRYRELDCRRRAQNPGFYQKGGMGIASNRGAAEVHVYGKSCGSNQSVWRTRLFQHASSEGARMS